jgi:hypothetical protein
MSFFDENGRRIPYEGLRFYSNEISSYYKLIQPKLDLFNIFDRIKTFNNMENDLSFSDFSLKYDELRYVINNNIDFSNLLRGVHIPFFYQNNHLIDDYGDNLERALLPCFKNSFSHQFPNSYFKAFMQAGSSLSGNINLCSYSNYSSFIKSSYKKPIIGLYFPNALQGYDILSQRIQMRDLPTLPGANVCLSGGIDICSALLGSPELLIDNEFYAPILCMSSYVHTDPRLILAIKSYGPHMEFWCMTQMLTPEVTQVSEQWSGGITIFI